MNEGWKDVPVFELSAGLHDGGSLLAFALSRPADKDRNYIDKITALLLLRKKGLKANVLRKERRPHLLVSGVSESHFSIFR